MADDILLDRILRMKDLYAPTGLRRAAIDKLRRQGLFPAGISARSG